MKNLFGFLLFFAGFLYFSYIGYILWIKPQDYVSSLQKKKANVKSKLWFFPEWLISFAFFFNHHKISLWWERIWISILIIICFLGALSAIFGPLNFFIEGK